METMLTANDFWNTINVFSSLVTFVNMIAFYLMIFGAENRLTKRPLWEQYCVKIGILSIAIGTFLNIMIWAYPPINEIIINIGLAFIFTWASIFHYNVFLRKR
jgi:hypothetical protein